MNDEEYEQIRNYLIHKYVPKYLPPNSKLRKAWTQRAKQNFCIEKEFRNGTIFEHLCYKYKKGKNLLGEKMVRTLKVPKSSEWSNIWTKFHIEYGHPGLQTTWAAINQYYYCPGLNLIVQKDIKACMCVGNFYNYKIYLLDWKRQIGKLPITPIIPKNRYDRVEFDYAYLEKPDREGNCYMLLYE